LDLSFDGASIFGGDRSKRYALIIENGAVKEAHVESDNTGLNGTTSSLCSYMMTLLTMHSVCRREGFVNTKSLATTRVL
jgi:peroxiredoxin